MHRIFMHIIKTFSFHQYYYYGVFWSDSIMNQYGVLNQESQNGKKNVTILQIFFELADLIVSVRQKR